jgi:hypothetical protein
MEREDPPEWLGIRLRVLRGHCSDGLEYGEEDENDNSGSNATECDPGARFRQPRLTRCASGLVDRSPATPVSRPQKNPSPSRGERA